MTKERGNTQREKDIKDEVQTVDRGFLKELFSIFDKRVANQLADKAGFIKRHRCITALGFLLTMTLGLLASSHCSLEGLSSMIGCEVTRQALFYRFSPSAVVFLSACLDHVLLRKVHKPLLSLVPQLAFF